PAADHDETGRPRDDLGDVALLGREIIDAVTGVFQQIGQSGPAMAAVPRFLVVDQRRARMFCGHAATNTAAGDATPGPPIAKASRPAPHPAVAKKLPRRRTWSGHPRLDTAPAVQRETWMPGTSPG